MSTSNSTEFLNAMLEAERAGAKALVVYMDDVPAQLRKPGRSCAPIQADEAHNCALIGKLIEKAGTPYSHATGKFHDKAVAVKGRARASSSWCAG